MHHHHLGNVNDSVLLMLVGMLNFLGAILLAHIRSSYEAVELPPLPQPGSARPAEAAAQG